MYKTTRKEAREKLWISTRSVDRYIRSWKLRAKKIWKIVYINTDDINNFLWWTKQEIILPKNKENKNEKNILKSKDENLKFIYEDLKNQIEKKDQKIEELIKINRHLEEIVKNSIPIVEFKKSQFLLEEWKETLKNEIISKEKEIEKINIKLKETTKLNLILIWISIVFFVILIMMFFIKI